METHQRQINHESPICGRSSECTASSKNLTRLTHKTNQRSQLSSFVLFISVIIIVNLCPFDPQPELSEPKMSQQSSFDGSQVARITSNLQACLGSSVEFVALMFTSPIKLGQRNLRFTLAEAKVIGKMAKVWFIKKKIKKLSKKLKKHTIAVPVFTAIPIYEHSYYPQPHVTHVTHAGMHHAASSYSPTQSAATSASQSQQLATSASNPLAAYRLAQPPPAHHGHAAALYHPFHAASHQIINAYAAAPSTYVDDSAGLYGHYGNAYGRYDGGYQYW